MSQQDEDQVARLPQRFAIELFIVHPTLDPAEITAALGLEPQHQHRVGDQRKTPKGGQLINRDTRWRYRAHFDVTDQWFARQVAEFVERLAPHKDFLRKIRSSGGTASIGIGFLGYGKSAYFWDEIPRATLSKLLELELDLVIEVV